MGKISSYLTAFILFLSFSVALQAQDQPSAASLYNEGLAQMKAKAFTEALPLMEQAIEMADPEVEAEAKVIQLAERNGAIAAYYVGSTLRKKENYEGAMEKFNQGIEFNPDFYANYIGKAQTLEGMGETVEAVKTYAMAAEATKKAGKAERAGKLVNKAENFAALAYADQNWDATVSHAMAFLEVKETADAHYYLSAALKAQGENEKAIEHAEAGMELEEGDDKGRYLMVKAESLAQMGKTDEAITVYESITSGKYAERAQYNADQLKGGK